MFLLLSKKSLGNVPVTVKYRKTFGWVLVYCFLGGYASKNWNMSESHTPSFIVKHNNLLYLSKVQHDEKQFLCTKSKS